MKQQNESASKKTISKFKERGPEPSNQTCVLCGQEQPIGHLVKLKTGTRRKVCNHCRWTVYEQPYRIRAILRSLEH